MYVHSGAIAGIMLVVEGLERRTRYTVLKRLMKHQPLGEKL